MAGEAWVTVELGHQVLAETNNGDGDCLFESISQQLEGEFSSVELRQIAVQYLTTHRVDMEEELLSLGFDMIESREIPFLEGEMLIDAVLQVLSNPMTWGGAECIAALSMSLSREIRVYQENGPTFIFPQGDNPSIRILLRYPRSGSSRRTHYESVLNWRAGPPVPAPTTSSTQDASTSTDAKTQSSEQVSNQLQENSQRSNPRMVLRPRRQDVPPLDLLRNENFSEPEDFEEDVEDLNAARFTKCKICRHKVGKYALLNCGCFPFCGLCIQTWYVKIENAPCPHCGRIVSGWTKFFNQN